jgi:hypothetical protein
MLLHSPLPERTILSLSVEKIELNIVLLKPLKHKNLLLALTQQETQCCWEVNQKTFGKIGPFNFSLPIFPNTAAN